MRSSRLALLLILVCGCGKQSANVPPGETAKWPDATVHTPKLSITKPDPAATPHLHNLLQLTNNIYSGGEPHGEEAFAELAKLGVKVIVSVDGARPNIEAAKKHGLRYVHIPIGYDGIPAEAGQSLARVVREADAAGDTVYFHCHHGKHRGPSAAAIACIAADAADNEAANQILVTAGTSKDYAGLWRDVAAYRPAAADAKLPELVEVAQVDSLVTAMSNIDRAFDNLKLSQAGDWKILADHPDIVAAQEALIVKEALHESGRNLAQGCDEQFVTWRREAETLAAKLETQLKAGDAGGANQTMAHLDAACNQCHTKHRN
ncbi:MAG: tyrosine-protein phosphatase [Pirellulales bacterium]